MVNGSGPRVRPDSIGVCFDDERLVANAGLVLTATLCERLGIERLVGGSCRRAIPTATTQTARRPTSATTSSVAS